jgi:ribosome-binding factor A
MPGQRHHQERVSEALKQEIATMLQGELADPRIGSITVTDVRTTPGGKSVHIFVDVQGDERQSRDTTRALTAAKGYVRHEIAERLGLQRPPDLVFHVGHALQHSARVEQLLQRINKRKSK